MREKRTVSVDFGLSISEYRRTQADAASFIECATATMRVVTHVKHAEDCARTHRYTRHSTRARPLHCKGSGFTRVPVSQIRCLDCGAVFTVLPSFILRYQRYEVRLAQDLLEYNLIMNISYRYQARILENNSPELANTSPMAMWRLMFWLGSAISVTTLLLQLGLKPPTAFIEDEKFVSEAGHQTYIAAIIKKDSLPFGQVCWASAKNSMTQGSQESPSEICPSSSGAPFRTRRGRTRCVREFWGGSAPASLAAGAWFFAGGGLPGELAAVSGRWAGQGVERALRKLRCAQGPGHAHGRAEEAPGKDFLARGQVHRPSAHEPVRQATSLKRGASKASGCSRSQIECSAQPS